MCPYESQIRMTVQIFLFRLFILIFFVSHMLRAINLKTGCKEENANKKDFVFNFL